MPSDLAEHLNGLSLGSFPPRFVALRPPVLAELAGTFRAELVGPSWFRTAAMPVLALGGLGGWWGKAFEADGRCHNIVQQGSDLVKVLPMEVFEARSLLDGRQGIAIAYVPGTRYPWPWVIDEIRWLDQDCLLGLSMFNRAALSRLVAPFLLWREQ